MGVSADLNKRRAKINQGNSQVFSINQALMIALSYFKINKIAIIERF